MDTDTRQQFSLEIGQKPRAGIQAQDGEGLVEEKEGNDDREEVSTGAAAGALERS